MAVVFIRTFIVYILVLLGVKLMGRRQIGELQTSELVTTILLSNISILPIQEISIPFLYGIIPLLALISFEVILSFICLKSTKTRYVISGRPKAIINNGIVDQKLLLDLRLSVDDLMSQLRQQQIFNIRDVELAMVEINGSISIYQKFNGRNPTTQMLNIPDNKTNNNKPHFTIISDGSIVKDNLRLCNKDTNWLNSTLKSNNKSPKDILLMTCDSDSNYVIIPKEI